MSGDATETDIVSRLRRVTVQVPVRGQALFSETVTHPACAAAADFIERQAADLSRMREALGEMLDWFGRPGRDEWNSHESWTQAKAVCERARAALSPAAETKHE